MTTTDDTPAPVVLPGALDPRLVAALVGLQRDLAPARKDRKNEHFGASYATLASCWEALRGPLATHGLAVVQYPGVDGRRVYVRTVVAHLCGAWLEGTVSAEARDASPQSVGSALTYLRRYGLGMLGLVMDDDDGQAAQPEAPRGRGRARAEPRPDPQAHHPSWEAGRARFCAALGELGLDYDTVAAECEARGEGRPSSWPSERRRAFVDGLRVQP